MTFFSGGRLLVLLAVLAGMVFAARGSAPSADSAVLGAPGRQSAPPTATHLPANRQGPFGVVLVIDAGRADEFNLASMPNLAKLAAGGTMYTNAWVGQLPSITESSHATIGTGVFPRRHMILGDTWRVPGTSQMSPNLLDSNLTRTGYIGKVIQQAGVPSLATFIHDKFPGSRVVAVSGHKIYAADALGAGTADYVAFGAKDSRGHFVPSAIPGHEPAQVLLKSEQLDLPAYPRQPGLEDNWTTTLALKFLFKYHPRLMLINLPEVDTFGHLAGTDATVMQPLITDVDREIGRLVAAYGRAGLLNQTYWFVTADHGMVPAMHTVDSTNVKAIIASAGGQPLYVGHGDYCPIWLANLNTVPRVAAALAGAEIPNVDAVYMRGPQGNYRLVSSPSRLADPDVRKTYNQLLSTYNEGESPDIVLMYDENTITMTPNFLKIGRKGDHEGATWGAQHIPLFVAGPTVRRGYVSNYPARLVDIAPTVEMLMGIRPKGQDGIPLADLTVSPPVWATQAQTHEAHTLASNVQALIDEAARRPNLKP
jgi:arylsulfatase A-like enzyme